MIKWGSQVKEIVKVAGSVTHEPYVVNVAGTDIKVERPNIRTQLRVSAHFATISDTPEDYSLADLIAYGVKAETLVKVGSLYLCGEENTEVMDVLHTKWCLSDLQKFVMDMTSRDGEFEGFFVFSTSLKDRNLLKPTKEVETVYGLSSEPSPNTTD